jgi:predicted secreted protein
MSKATDVAMFFLIWWVVLFAVLPWGVHSQHEGGEMAPGTDPGAPVIPRLGRKLAWTTLVAGLVFAAFYFILARHMAQIGSLMSHFGPHFVEKN